MTPKKHSKTGPKARKSTVKASAGKNQTLSYGGAAKKTKSTKKTTQPKVSRVVTTTTTRTEVNYRQTGTGNRKYSAIQADDKRLAELPGKRTSKSGRVYYERRANRSDTPGQRAAWKDKYGRRK